MNKYIYFNRNFKLFRVLLKNELASFSVREIKGKKNIIIYCIVFNIKQALNV